MENFQYFAKLPNQLITLKKNMRCVGIDAGGSNLRVGLFSEKLECMHLKEFQETANPCIIGFEKVGSLLRASLIETLHEASVEKSEVKCIGAGMAGAAQAPEWLKKELASLFPKSKITIAPDYEIALIGAHGKRYGILIISGTGSSAYGINEAGESVHSGGWGYLIGDEGGGYWLGIQTLKAVANAADGFEEKTGLYQKIFHHLKISHPDDLISWTYNPVTTNRKIAQISELVLEVAASGDPVATKIVESAAEHLFQLYQNLVERLNFIDPPVMFAGGLLTSETLLQQLLMKKMGLKDAPCPKYTPVVGAALMAQMS